MLGAKGDEKASSESIYEFSVLCHFEVPSTLYYNIGVIYECRNNWNYVALKMLQRKKTGDHFYAGYSQHESNYVFAPFVLI